MFIYLLMCKELLLYSLSDGREHESEFLIAARNDLPESHRELQL